MGEFNEARETFVRAEEASKDPQSLILQKALLEADARNYPEALRLAANAAVTDIKGRSYQVMGLVHVMLGEYSEAEDKYLKAVELGLVIADVTLGRLKLLQVKLPEAETTLLASLHHFPTLTAPRVGLAIIAGIRGNQNVADKMYNAVIDLFPINCGQAGCSAALRRFLAWEKPSKQPPLS